MLQWGGRLARLRREALAAMVLASLLVILHHIVPVIDILDKFAFLFAASNSVTAAAPDAATVVLGIDQNTFERDFLEQSPLNRCVLAEQLRTVYAERPATLVLDLDLSPSLAGVLGQGPDQRRELACEASMYGVISAALGVTRTVLLAPIIVAAPAAQAAKEAWRAGMQAKGVQFGDGTLPVQFGVVLQQYVQANTLAALAHSAPAVPASHAGSATPSTHAAAIHSAADSKDHEPAAPHLQLLNFRAFARDVRSLRWDEWRAAPAASPLTGKTVFMGANYGADDRFVTPIDDLYGVNLHAGAFVSLDQAITAVPGTLGLLIDIAIGVLFGRVVGIFWQRYLRAVAVPATRSMAFLSLMQLVLVYAALIGGLGWLAVKLIVGSNIWISPLPMALGMAADAFILGAVHAAVHATEHARGASVHGALAVAPDTLSTRDGIFVQVQDYAKIALGAGIVAYALFLIWRH